MINEKRYDVLQFKGDDDMDPSRPIGNFKTFELACEEDDLTCGICKGPYNVPHRMTTCFHTYCYCCIEPWVNNNGSCPECRFPLTVKELKFAFDINNRLSKLLERMNVKPTISQNRIPKPMCCPEPRFPDEAPVY